mgnify:CR=1 FL=1
MESNYVIAAEIGIPRKTAVSGRPLPTGRDVSLTVHSNINQPVLWSDTLTMAVMQMGQFVDHDGILGPLEEGKLISYKHYHSYST